MTIATPGKGPSIGGLVLRTFLWMPVCFAAWYFTARYHAAIAGALARGFANLWGSGVIAGLERAGNDLLFVTTLQAPGAGGAMGAVMVEVNPLTYTYGVALFLALMLASRASFRKIVLGAAALLPFQGWGIAFDFLAQVGVRMGPEVAARAGFPPGGAEAIVLGYQLGALIFPSLVPVMAWVACNPAYLKGLLAARGSVAASASQSSPLEGSNLPGAERP